MTDFSLPKTPTGIQGLDLILEGGLPAGRTSVVSGGPGSGKTVLGLQFLVDGANSGSPGIFTTFEETADAVRQNALTLGWDLAAFEKAGKLMLLDNRLTPELIVSGEFNLEGLAAAVSGATARIGAARIVLDAVDIMLSLFPGLRRKRSEILKLQQLFREKKLTALITQKSRRPGEASGLDFMDWMVDCVVHLNQSVEHQVTTRRLRVKKYRGSGFGRNEYPYTIGTGGITILPVSTLGLRHQPLGDYISSGLPDLDRVLGGGFRRASSILIAGTTGTGKTSLAATFARSTCSAGEKLLYVSFEESREAMMTNMRSPGIDLGPAYEAGLLRYVSGLPESMGAEEHLLKTFLILEEFYPQHLVVDSISACNRMGSERAAFDYLVRLLNLSKERGITCILLNQTVAPSSIQELSGVEISSLIDAVLSLHLADDGGELNRTLICLKSRGSAHSNQYREYRITGEGIVLLPVYTGDGKVLTGTARRIREAADTARALEMDQEIEARQRELEILRASRSSLENGFKSRVAIRGGFYDEN